MQRSFAFATSLLCTALAIASCNNNEIDFKSTLGREDVRIVGESYHDFIGSSIHNEIFDFKEYCLNPKDLQLVLNSSDFSQFPKYNSYLSFYKKTLQNVDSSQWKTTPVQSKDIKYFAEIFKFSNIQNYDASKKLMANDFEHSIGNYYSYFSAYPSGIVLYMIVPSESKLYVIRKRG